MNKGKWLSSREGGVEVSDACLGLRTEQPMGEEREGGAYRNMSMWASRFARFGANHESAGLGAF